MKKTIICNIPMKREVYSCLYTSEDLSVPIENIPVQYPINAFLAKTLSPDDQVKALLLVKEDGQGNWEKNCNDYKAEMAALASQTGAKIEYVVIQTEFNEKKVTHEQLMGSIVEEIEEASHIVADITYGPKDVPIVVFAALNFAEKHLNCEIDNILYGQANFVDQKPTNTRICDMSPLYYLSSVTDVIRCDKPEEAKTILKSILSL